jgi:hypothetical protein
MDVTTRAFPSCKLPFRKLPFAQFTFNVGPRCCSKRHYDHLNEAIGWCLVSPFGHWDHTLGGHIILHKLKLIVEFPPGSSLLLPSALVAHENISISTEERRMVITAYTSGSFFQYADNQFTTLKTIPSNVYIEDGESVWRRALKRLPILSNSFYYLN